MSLPRRAVLIFLTRSQANTISKLAASRPVNLSRDRQILTRFQELQIRKTFPLLDLPPELRNMIYELCLTTKGIKTHFKRYYAKIRTKQAKGEAKEYNCRKKTPAILLVNRQIFNEAVGMIEKLRISFHHGLFAHDSITRVVSESVLQRVSLIILTFKGHKVLQSNILGESWHGQMRLIRDLGDILTKDHKLKTLTIDITDPEMTIHTQSCWYSPSAKCDFRDHLMDAFEHLQGVRGVGCVTLKGFPEKVAIDLKASMEKKKIGFFGLPGEIRNIIYGYCVDLSIVNKQFNKYTTARARWYQKAVEVRNPNPDPVEPTLGTPSILLVNKRITNEVLYIIRNQALSITFPGDRTIQHQPQIPRLLSFITPTTVQHLSHISLRLETWEWVYGLEALFSALTQKHSLKSFHFYLKDCLKQKFLHGMHTEYPDGRLHGGLKLLRSIRGIKDVKIEGDLPEVHAGPLRETMMGEVRAKKVPKLMAMTRAGGVTEVEEEAEDEETRDEAIDVDVDA